MSHEALHARIQESLSRQVMLTTLGARLVRVAEGEVEIELPFNPGLTQQHGFLHAGAVATIADSACGYACLTRMPPDSSILSVEFKINLLAPARGAVFVAKGRAVRVGKTIGVATAEVFAAGGAGETTCIAVMQATMMRLESKPGRTG
jgi:uncharacterized protein (TIGR00369 family)